MATEWIKKNPIGIHFFFFRQVSISGSGRISEKIDFAVTAAKSTSQGVIKDARGKTTSFSWGIVTEAFAFFERLRFYLSTKQTRSNVRHVGYPLRFYALSGMLNLS